MNRTPSLQVDNDLIMGNAGKAGDVGEGKEDDEEEENYSHN